MSNTNEKKTDSNSVLSDTKLEDLNLEELLARQKEIEKVVEKKRTASVQSFFLDMVNFLEKNNVPVREFFELGESAYVKQTGKQSQVLNGISFHEETTDAGYFAQVREATAKKPKRTYRKAKARFQNPDNPKETWAGRGKMPIWMEAKLKKGANKDDFLIPEASEA